MVAYREQAGLAVWRRRNSESPVPGRWPYGLDELTAQLPGTVPIDVPPLSGVRARLAAVLGVRPARGGTRSRAALAWNELTAVDMLARVPARSTYAGVIWATDAVRAGDDSRQLRRIRSALGRMTALWVLSRPQADAVRDWLGPSCPPVHFLRFGIDANFYRPAEAPPPHPHVVSVGGDRDRDATTLFAALERVHRERPEVRLTVQSKSDAAAPSGVTVVPSLRHVEVAGLLRSASVVALATRPNLHASGMTVGLEAQASGAPVVVCDTPGMRDYFVDGETARLVPPGDPERMAAAILGLLATPDDAARMGAKGREHVLAAHTTLRMCAGIAAIVRGDAAAGS